MQQVLDAIQQGDSCISATAEQVAALQHLHMNLQRSALNPDPQIAPFVFDGQRLYLYRYWKLEHQVASDILRIQAQPPLSFELQAEQLNFVARSTAAKSVTDCGNSKFEYYYRRARYRKNLYFGAYYCSAQSSFAKYSDCDGGTDRQGGTADAGSLAKCFE